MRVVISNRSALFQTIFITFISDVANKFRPGEIALDARTTSERNGFEPSVSAISYSIISSFPCILFAFAASQRTLYIVQPVSPFGECFFNQIFNNIKTFLRTRKSFIISVISRAQHNEEGNDQRRKTENYTHPQSQR